ncbi:murein biosynthesis integral membrane protein MurJ [Rhodobacterales bacterium 52_120_T64]|nr:murein biosynthesis integral membrane protein MurJ [Rhodobacterales bacterium 52_120_T64]
MTRQIRLMSGFFTVGGWTLISRVLGFTRDIMIAAFLGSGPVAEAFLIAFSLPNMFRRFFGEGAFNTAFIPLFSKKVEGGEDAKRFAEDAMAGLATILIIFTVAAQLLMPWMVLAMASGFVADARFDLTVDFARVTFPYILFISISALISGVLNSFGRFAAAAAAPVLLNIILIGTMWIAHRTGGDIGWALVYGVPVAGLGQMGMLWWAASRAGMKLRLRLPRMTPELKRLAIIAGPAALAGGVVQVNLLVGRQVASYFDGAIAWLNYADRLYQLPLGVVGIAIGVVLLPDLSRRLRAGDDAGSQNSVNRAAEFTLLLTLPAAVALVVVPFPIVSVLFQRGAFDAQDAYATALAVSIYGFGLPSFVLHKVLSPIYFAREDTRTPFRFALVSMVVNLALAVGLSYWFGYLAAAIGTSVAGWAMLILLWRGTRHLGTAGQMDDRLKRVLPKIIIASLLMGLAVWGLSILMQGLFVTPTIRYAALALLISVGAIVYASLIIGLGAMSLSEIKQGLRRG